MGFIVRSAAGKKRKLMHLIGFWVLCVSVDDNQRFEATLKITAVVAPKRWQLPMALWCH